jgi:hypothetical protein
MKTKRNVVYFFKKISTVFMNLMVMVMKDFEENSFGFFVLEIQSPRKKKIKRILFKVFHRTNFCNSVNSIVNDLIALLASSI